jgi:hypothetical protein
MTCWTTFRTLSHRRQSSRVTFGPCNGACFVEAIVESLTIWAPGTDLGGACADEGSGEINEDRVWNAASVGSNEQNEVLGWRVAARPLHRGMVQELDTPSLAN